MLLSLLSLYACRESAVFAIYYRRKLVHTFVLWVVCCMCVSPKYSGFMLFRICIGILKLKSKVGRNRFISVLSPRTASSGKTVNSERI